MKLLFKYSAILLLMISPLYAQKDITGYWDGKIKLLSMNLNFQMKIQKQNKTFAALMSIPSQKVKEYKLPVFTLNKAKVHFELPSSAGTAQFDGTFKGDSIKGSILQAGIKGTFSLVRSVEPAPEPPKEVKPAEPVPYNEEEVAFKSGRILLAGTLTYPKEDKLFPAVVLLTGTGPQNRDEDILGFKLFQLIADYLTRNGIAVLRYDDRGVGGSTGNTMQSTTEDFAGDAVAAVEFLNKQKMIDKSKIGLLGHSEGGIIAPLAASKSNGISFLVLMSGAGVKGADVLIEQQKLILKASNVSDDLIQENIKLQESINDALINDKDIRDLQKEIKLFAEKDYNSLAPDVKKAIQDKNAYINSTVVSQINMFNNPWFHFYAKYDPAPALENLKIPVLMTFGELDLQMPALQNKPRMEEALKKGGNNNFKSILFPKANHLYQLAVTGSPSEYSDLKKEFVPGFLPAIAEWIKSVIK